MQRVKNTWSIGTRWSVFKCSDIYVVFQTAIFLMLFVKNNKTSWGIDGRTSNCLSIDLRHTKTIENINVWKWTEARAMKNESSRAAVVKTNSSGARAVLMNRRALEPELCHFYGSSVCNIVLTENHQQYMQRKYESRIPWYRPPCYFCNHAQMIG